MLQGLSNAVDNLVTDLSGRRVGAWVLIILLGVSGVVVYELYTNQFRLGRLSNQAQVLEQLQRLQSHSSLERDSTLRQTYQQVRDQLAESAERDSVLPAVPPRVSQAIAAFTPWLLLMLLFAGVPLFRPATGVGNMLAGMVIVAVPFTAVGAVLPPSWPTVLTHILYPVVGTALVLFLAWSAGRK